MRGEINRNTVLELFLIISVALVWIPEALALPQYLDAYNTTFSTNGTCGICHVDPAGGGQLNTYGMLFENQTNHATDPGAALMAIGRPANLTSSPTPTPTTGSIFVSSFPPNASIYLEGSYQGTTPETLTEIATGSHTITLKLTGYEDWSQTIDVTADQTSEVSVTLTPTPTLIVTPTPTPDLNPTPTPSPSITTGSISISSVPTGASIYLDGNYQGTTPETLTDIAEGSHDITLNLAGYEDWSQTIDVVAGQTSSVSPELILAQQETTTPVHTETTRQDSSNLYLYGIVILAVILIAIAVLKLRGSYQKTKPVETEIIKRPEPSGRAEHEPVKETLQPPIPEEEQKPDKCPKCGAEVHAGDRFCEECGEPLGF